MKELRILKNEMRNKQYGHFYVFTGEDWGLKKHYISYISSIYDDISGLDDTATVNGMLGKIVDKNGLKKKAK